MRYAVVNAENETVSLVDHNDLDEVKKSAGLEPLGVDHGTVKTGLGIILYEFGLLEPNEHYFILNRTLYAGNAVLYAFNEHGETVSVPRSVLAFEIKFLHSINAVEAALKKGEADRPYTSINGVKISEWHNGSLRSL